MTKTTKTRSAEPATRNVMGARPAQSTQRGAPGIRAFLRSVFRARRSALPPVLCYHRVGGPLELGVTRVGRTVFARQMRALAQAGWRSLTLAEYAEQINAERGTRNGEFGATGSEFRTPRSAFLLTFDDGYATLADDAYPVLADVGFTATTFLITDYVGKTNLWDGRYTWRRLRHLHWATVERWRARGFDFASHGATHRRLTWLGDDAVRDDLERSRDALVGRWGEGAGGAIAYPFGAVDGRVARLAFEAGFRLGFGGVRGVRGDPLRLPRMPVYVWDAFAVPTGLRRGWLGWAGRVVAHVANRCSVGTSVMLGVVGR